MKKWIYRLKSKNGETLVETMAAILIFTFGSIIMLSMISSAANINSTVKEADENYFKDMQVVEMASGTPQTVSITFSIAERPDANYNEVVYADMYSREAGGLYAYYWNSAPQPGGEG